MTTPSPAYGCHNRPEFKPLAVVQDGWFMDGFTRVPKMVSVPFRMSTECQYRHTDLGKSDTRCDGCRHRVNFNVTGAEPAGGASGGRRS